MKQPWSETEKKHVADHYHAIGNKDLTRLLSGRTEYAIFAMAKRIGVKKSHDRLREVGRENVSKRRDRQCDGSPFKEPPSPSC